MVLVLYTDSLALSWMRGKRDALPRAQIERTHRYMWLGISVMVTTGVLMFYPFREYLLYHPPFQFKMGFVITLIVNGLVIGKLMHVATERRFADLLPGEKMKLLLSGAISTLSWLGALTMATMLDL